MQNSKQSKPNKTKEPEKPAMSSETLILFAAEIRNAIESGKTAMSEALIACDIVVKVMIQCGINFPPNRFREMCGFEAKSPLNLERVVDIDNGMYPTDQAQIPTREVGIAETFFNGAPIGQWVPNVDYTQPDINVVQVIRTDELDRAIREILADPHAAIQTRVEAAHYDPAATRELTATEIAMARNAVGDTTRPAQQSPF